MYTHIVASAVPSAVTIPDTILDRIVRTGCSFGSRKLFPPSQYLTRRRRRSFALRSGASQWVAPQ